MFHYICQYPYTAQAHAKEFGNGRGFPARKPQEQGGNTDANPSSGDGIGSGQEGLAGDFRVAERQYFHAQS